MSAKLTRISQQERQGVLELSVWGVILVFYPENLLFILIGLIFWADSLGVRIINCSWDSTIYNQELKSTKYKDILLICAAGKNKTDLNKIAVYPACYDLPNVVSVVAINNQGNLYSLSGYGSKAQVAAPGVDIYSIMPDGDNIYSSGTSAATAYVSGIAALIKSYKPQCSSTEIAEILRVSTKKIPALKGKVASGGIIDAYLCLKNAEKKLENKSGLQ